MSCLLHGNEPSGFVAMVDVLRRGERVLALEDEIDDLLRSRRSAFGPSARPARAGSTA